MHLLFAASFLFGTPAILQLDAHWLPTTAHSKKAKPRKKAPTRTITQRLMLERKIEYAEKKRAKRLK